MFAYMRGWALQHGASRTPRPTRNDEAEKAWQKAAAEPGDYCFPSRPEEYAALAAAATCGADAQQRVPPAANTHYYLGEILWFRDRKDDAIAAWRACVAQKGDHALALRCLGFALSHPGTYFTNTGVPSGVANEEAYGFYLRAMEADPANAHVLLETDELAEKLKIPAAKRRAYLEARRATVDRYDPVLLRLVELFNETRSFDQALEILSSRTFYVWEGGRSLLTVFTDAALGCGVTARARGDNKKAAAFFQRALEYPENLQCAPGASAGVAPQANLFLAECRAAMGDADGARGALQAACAGWNLPGEMNFYRAEALVRLAKMEGRAPDAAAVKAELDALDGAIAQLEKPLPKELHASRKFFAGTSRDEAERANRCQAKYLRGLKAFHEGRKDEAAKLFDEAVAGRPSLVWAAYWRTRCAR
jgi:tetratricopeptide (TPR) repeat protein